MGALRNLLLWNANATNPFFLSLVLAAMIGITLLIMAKPRVYVPLMLMTAAVPKLFTLSRYSDVDVTGAVVSGAAGFSVVDMVLAGGLAALLFRHWKKLPSANARAFARSATLWCASVAASVGVGFLVWSGTYRPLNMLYAVRYILTVASFSVAAQFARHHVSESTLRKLLYRFALTGNVTIFLGLLYYFTFGSSAGGAHAVSLFDASTPEVFRSYLWFFDYGNDMGFFAALIGILNIVLLSDRRLMGMRPLIAVGLLACIAAILFIGERANIVVMAGAVIYFLRETSRLRHRSVRVGLLFQISCVAAVILAVGATFYLIAPEDINRKFESAVGANENARQAGLGFMASADVPDAIASTIVALPVGDNVARLSLNVTGLWFFFNHPEGVGFWGELGATHLWSHHEFIKIAMEQGIPGIAAFIFLIIRLRRLLWSNRNMSGSFGQFSVMMRSISVGLFVALVMANTVLLDMKFMLVYWTLVGVWSVIPAQTAPVKATIRIPAQFSRREPARV